MAIKTTRLPGIVEIKDPGNAGTFQLPSHHHAACALTSAGSETRVLGSPQFFGQMITASFDADGGNLVLTAAATVNQTGNNTLTFADAGEEITLRGVIKAGALLWRVVSNDGVALSTV